MSRAKNFGVLTATVLVFSCAALPIIIGRLIFPYVLRPIGLILTIGVPFMYFADLHPTAPFIALITVFSALLYLHKRCSNV